MTEELVRDEDVRRTALRMRTEKPEAYIIAIPSALSGWCNVQCWDE